MKDHTCHILLAEDDAIVREITQAMLLSFGYAVTAVANGAEASVALRNIKVDLILSDVRMPVCDGFEFLQEIRKNPAYSRIPFIIVSAKADSTEVRMGMSLGADDYVTKPYEPADLQEAITVRLNHAKRINELIEHNQRFLVRTLPHELRTPLTGLMGYADMMCLTAEAGQTLSVEELADYGQMLRLSGERLLNIVQNFALWNDLDRIGQDQRNGKVLPVIEHAVNPAGLSSVARESAAKYSRLPDLMIDCNIEAVIEIVMGDFLPVVRGLIDNAFKYSLPGDRVRISTRAESGMFYLSVKDKGWGMTAEQIAKIGLMRQFDRDKFEQQGMGLGLAIAALFAQLSGGKLELQRDAESKGLTVIMSLPRAKTSSRSDG